MKTCGLMKVSVKRVNAALLILMLMPIVAAEPQAPLERPSDLVKPNVEKGRFTLAFVTQAVPDFRVMYCRPGILQTKIRADVCVVDADGSSAVEVRVGQGETVGSVLR